MMERRSGKFIMRISKHKLLFCLTFINACMFFCLFGKTHIFVDSLDLRLFDAWNKFPKNILPNGGEKWWVSLVQPVESHL